jgi:predicted nucleic acid-binding protein
MRVLVDSTVFIDFIGGRETAQVAQLEKCFQAGDEVCYCGFVLTEVLQGIREAKQLVAVKRQFESLTYLEDDRSTFELGATIYRELRRDGITIRNSIDCLIAATVIQHGAHFLEHDRDYKFIDQHFPLNRI